MEEQQIKTKPKKIKILIVFIIIFFLGYLFGRTSISVSLNSPSFSEALNSLEVHFQGPDINQDFFGDVLTAIKQQYYKQPVSDKDLFYGVLRGLVSGLGDQYSVFFDPQQAKDLKTELSGSFEGIGAEIGLKKGIITIVAPLEGMPADKAGLKAGDQILAINNEDTLSLSLDEAVSKIRGPRGTVVKLLIMRDSFTQPQEFSVSRDVIDIKSVKYEIKDNKIVYLRVSYFNENTLTEFEEAARKIAAASPRGIILDLRDNPGGYLYEAVEMAGWWTGPRLVVSERGNDGKDTEHISSRQAVFDKIQTIVLVNNGSASASEILAGALQDYGLAKIVGETTFGKGTVQELIELKDGSLLKITIAQWLTPKKREIEEKGIKPDLEVKITDQDIEKNNDSQLNKALELLK
jgi:carboxyl-terminal processing protease